MDVLTVVVVVVKPIVRLIARGHLARQWEVVDTVRMRVVELVMAVVMGDVTGVVKVIHTRFHE